MKDKEKHYVGGLMERLSLALRANCMIPERLLWGIIGSFVVLGVLIRVVWLVAHPISLGGSGEAENVAIALVTKGSFSDAQYVGQGPTAHLTPISPLIAAGLLSIFGIGTVAANSAMVCWSLLQVFGSCLLLVFLFKRIGTPPLGILIAVASFCVIPLFIGNETIQFAYWANALAVNLMVASLLTIITMDGRGAPSWKASTLAALLFAATFFVTPTLGVGVYVAALIFAFRNIPVRRLAGTAIIAALALAITVAPWAIRNSKVMGSTVLLRDNAGLQLALANYPGAVRPQDPYEAYENRLREIAPHFSEKARNAMRAAGGEAQYNQKLGREAKSWISHNRMDFITITARHLTEFYLPRPWQFRHLSTGKFTLERSVILTIIEITGLISVLLAAWFRSRKHIYLLPIIVLTGPIYAIFQPLPRYIYLVYGLMLFLAADLVTRFLYYKKGLSPRLFDADIEDN